MIRRFSNEMIIVALKKTGGLVSLAAKQLGCNPQTIYNRVHAFPKIQEAIDEARVELIDLAEQRLKKAVKSDEPWAISLVLKTLGKSRGYVENPSVAVGVNVNDNTVVENVIIHLPDNGR